MHRKWPEVGSTERRDVLIAYDSHASLGNSQVYFGIKDIEDLEYFQSLVADLASGRRSHADISDASWAMFEGLDSMLLEVVPDAGRVLIERNRQETVCRWSCTPHEWELAGELISALLGHGGPAHQYLPPEQGGVEIELDYGGPKGGEKA
jgi:hypothetical protein